MLEGENARSTVHELPAGNEDEHVLVRTVKPALPPAKLKLPIVTGTDPTLVAVICTVGDIDPTCVFEKPAADGLNETPACAVPPQRVISKAIASCRKKPVLFTLFVLSAK